MPKPVDPHEATTNSSQPLDQVCAEERGESVKMSSQGGSVARYVPGPAAERVFGVDAGVFSVPDGFDTPLPNDLLASFE